MTDGGVGKLLRGAKKDKSALEDFHHAQEQYFSTNASVEGLLTSRRVAINALCHGSKVLNSRLYSTGKIQFRTTF